MTKFILHTINGENFVTSPAPGIDLPILDVAKRSVPLDVPFWIVDEKDMPSEETPLNEWDVSESMLGIPDGDGEKIIN